MFARFYKPFDENIVKVIAQKYCNVFIYDSYSDFQGFAVPLTAHLLSQSANLKIHSFALPNAFIPQGDIQQQLKSLSLDLNSVVAAISSLL